MPSTSLISLVGSAEGLREQRELIGSLPRGLIRSGIAAILAMPEFVSSGQGKEFGLCFFRLFGRGTFLRLAFGATMLARRCAGRRCLGELEIGMHAHPFEKPFRTTFIQEKRAVGFRSGSADRIARDVAKQRDFFDGEHLTRIVSGNFIKLLLVMLHINPSFQGVVTGTTGSGPTETIARCRLEGFSSSSGNGMSWMAANNKQVKRA